MGGVVNSALGNDQSSKVRSAVGNTLRLHRSIQASSKPLALAIGNFDGVHLGHQAILDQTKKAAAHLGMTPAALTFWPLPREYFARVQRHGDASTKPMSRLMSVTEKLAAFQRAGLAEVLMPRFDRLFAAQSPIAFLEALRDANVRWLMAGADFRFGAKRAGDIELMRSYGAEHGIRVETMADIACADGSRISSSAIRAALAAGRLDLAESMLGRPYSVVGRVSHGKKLGRTLNFPTANISLTGRNPALGGVFAVQCKLVTRGLEGVAGQVSEGEVIFNGVANLGTNPVVSSENRQHLEVFLFDFSRDLYGQRLHVTFIEKIRDEQQFSSLDGLVMQMHDDTARAKDILSRNQWTHPVA